MSSKIDLIVVSKRMNRIWGLRLPLHLIAIISVILVCIIVITAVLFVLNTREIFVGLNISNSEREHSILLGTLDSLRAKITAMQDDFGYHIKQDNRERTYWEMAFIHPDIWSMGIGGYKPNPVHEDLSGHTAGILENIYESIDALKEKCYLRNASLQDIQDRIESKQYLWSHIPSGHPVPGRSIGSRFGYRVDPINKRTIKMHWGVDIGAPRGTPIHATADGVVSYTSWNKGYGLCLDIDHGFGFRTRYAHCSSILVKPGDLVMRGQIVANIGNTGRTTCSHLHYEVHVSGVKVDPMPYIDLSAVVVD